MGVFPATAQIHPPAISIAGMAEIIVHNQRFISHVHLSGENPVLLKMFPLLPILNLLPLV